MRRHAAAIAALAREIGQRRELGKTLFGVGHQQGVSLDYACKDNLLAPAQLHAAHAPGGQPHAAHFLFGEADGLAAAAHQQQIARAVRAQRPAQAILVVQIHDNRAAVDVLRYMRQAHPLDASPLAGEEQVAAGVISRGCAAALNTPRPGGTGHARQPQRGGGSLLALQPRELGGRLVVRLQFVDAQARGAPRIGKNIEQIARVGLEERRFGPLCRLAQRRLREAAGVGAAQRAVAAHAHPHLLLGEQVVRGVRAACQVDNLRTARVTVLLLDFQQVALDER